MKPSNDCVGLPSLDNQTQSLLQSRTDEICRGSLVYMVPEIHTEQLTSASPSLVLSCYGCSQSLKAVGIVANPPHDLVIVSSMKPSYRDPSTLEMRSQEGNVYFRVQKSCIRRKQSYFVPQMVSIPHGLLALLKTEHLHYFTGIWIAHLNIKSLLKTILQLAP